MLLVRFGSVPHRHRGRWGSWGWGPWERRFRHTRDGPIEDATGLIFTGDKDEVARVSQRGVVCHSAAFPQ